MAGEITYSGSGALGQAGGSNVHWLRLKVNTRYLSPLIAAYDEKLTEKDEKLKLLKAKIDDLTKKFKSILDENSDLHTKLDRLPSNIRLQDQSELNDQ